MTNLLFCAGYIIDIREIDITISASQKITQHQQETVYRIDKDETLSSYSTPLSNLSKLLSPESPRDEKLRKLVIRAEAPSFCVETSDAHDRYKLFVLLTLNNFTLKLELF